MLFIMFSLIIRTAWQGKMFEFMQKNMTKPQIQSIDELAEKNFTIMIQPVYLDYFQKLNLNKKLRNLFQEETE